MVVFDDRELVKQVTVREFKSAKDLVLCVLKKSQRSRNDDKWLILKCLEFQGMDLEVLDRDSGTISWLFTVDELRSMHSFETLTRCRRAVQNKDGCFLPTDPVVIHRRRIREDVIKRYYGVDSVEFRQWGDLFYGVR